MLVSCFGTHCQMVFKTQAPRFGLPLPELNQQVNYFKSPMIRCSTFYRKERFANRNPGIPKSIVFMVFNGTTIIFLRDLNKKKLVNLCFNSLRSLGERIKKKTTNNISTTRQLRPSHGPRPKSTKRRTPSPAVFRSGVAFKARARARVGGVFWRAGEIGKVAGLGSGGLVGK